MAKQTNHEIPADDILAAIKDLQFGVVEVHVHESKVTEIRQIRRTRFERPNRSDPTAKQAGDADS
jgi:hypothetical protein